MPSISMEKVTINGVEYVPAPDVDVDEDYDNYDNDYDDGVVRDADGEEIVVGNFVKVRLSRLAQADQGFNADNRYGKVVGLSCLGESIAVEFPTAHSARHNCEGYTKAGHGYWFAGDDLRVIP